jgi:hypothetical protein
VVVSHQTAESLGDTAQFKLHRLSPWELAGRPPGGAGQADQLIRSLLGF